MPNGSNLQWIKAYTDPGELDSSPIGGRVIQFIAAGTLNLGDAVFLSAANTVAKTNAAAAYSVFAGIVVGGDLTGDYIAEERDLAGGPAGTTIIQASSATKRALVQVDGIAWVTSDGAAVAVAVPVTGGTVNAGRISVTGATAGQIIGTTITASGAANTKQKMLIRPR